MRENPTYTFRGERAGIRMIGRGESVGKVLSRVGEDRERSSEDRERSKNRERSEDRERSRKSGEVRGSHESEDRERL